MIAGSCCSGKTTLLHRYTEGNFDSFYPTIGVDFSIRFIDIDGNKIKVQIWDTASQERFRSTTSLYYNRSDGFVICFDVNSLDSFQSIQTCINEIEQSNVDKKIPIVLFGNKIDEDRREVSFECAKKFASDNGWKYFETSAKLNKGFEEGFRFIIIKSLQYLSKTKH